MSKTVLIIEDDAPSMEFFDMLLKDNGYDTLRAGDGLEGLKLARDHQPDMILVDFLLPELSGLEVAKLLKSDDILKNIPLIATTAFPFEHDDEVFKEGGFDGYLTKPVSVPDFLEMLNKHIN